MAPNLLIASSAALLLSSFAPHAVDGTATSSVLARAALIAQLQPTRLVSRQGSLALLQKSEPQGAAARTLRSLDTNGDGLVSRSEIASFASAQGLDAAGATNELSSLDVDGDGALNMSELSGALDSIGAASDTPSSPAPVAQVATVQAAPAVAPQPIRAVTPQAAAPQQVQAVATPSAGQQQTVLAAQADQSVTGVDRDAAMERLRNLDTNKDGLVGRDEIAAFATSQGLDAASVTTELSALDTDGDGSLSMNELLGAVDSVTSSGDAGNAASAAPSAAAAPAPAALATSVRLPSASAVSASAVQTGTLAAESVKTTAAEAAAAARRTEQITTAARVVSSQRDAARTVTMSSEFVKGKAHELFHSLESFEGEVMKAREEAAALRAKAKAELKQAEELSAIADSALLHAADASSPMASGAGTSRI